MSWFLVKACPKCQADLASDDGDWLCLQCGTYYYGTLPQFSSPAYGTNKSNRPAYRREAADQSSSREDSQVQPIRLGPEEEFPKGQEKSLVWALRSSQAVAVSAPEPSMAVTSLKTASMLRPLSLESFQR